MPFTTNLTGSTQLDDSLVLAFDQQFIIAAAEMGVMDQFVSYKQDIGAKSIQLTKYNQLALATTPLTETDDVVSAAMSDSSVVFTPAEYGNAVTKTSLASLQTGGKADVAAARMVGINMARTLDKLAILAGEASSNQLTKNGGAVNTQASTDIMSGSFLNQLYNKLGRANVAPLSGGMYVAIMHDDVINDLRSGTGAGSWQDITKYSSSTEVFKNEVGSYYGFRIVRDNHVTIGTDLGATNTDTYKTLCLGFNALGKAESQPAQMVLSGPFDKLGRFINVGWKACVQYKIVDQDAIWTGVSASSVGVNGAG
jgi:N4-gp56 family major capsid protein